jgi:hypothetical protein
MEDAADAGQRFRLRRIDAPHPSARIRAAQDADRDHPRKEEILRIARASGHALGGIDAAALVTDLGPAIAVEERKVATFDKDE